MSLASRITPTTYVSRSDPFTVLDRWLGDVPYAARVPRSDVAASLASPLAAPLASDLVETDTAWILDVAVPGLGPDGVVVDVEQRSLTVRATFARDVGPSTPASGGTSDDAPTGGDIADLDPSGAIRVHHRTLPRGEVVFRFRVPASTDVSAIDARIADGMLRITMPKIAEAKVRTIPVHRA